MEIILSITLLIISIGMGNETTDYFFESRIRTEFSLSGFFVLIGIERIGQYNVLIKGNEKEIELTVLGKIWQ